MSKKSVLKKLNQKGLIIIKEKKPNRSAYIHIPFCKHKCLYCDFNSFQDCDDLIKEYIESLLLEIKKYSINELYTIYIGGGTPSYIDAKYIKNILEVLPNAEEITLELNPGTINYEKLLNYKNAGINRLSIGLQSANNEILKEIGRIHTVEDFEESYKLARSLGFNNISVDLMFGLPRQNLSIFKESLQCLISLNPEHISAYSLILHNDIFKNLPPEEEERAMYHYLVKRLKEAGYVHYEISNFAKPSCESKHNIIYWRQKEYYGFGAGASSFLNNKRYKNEKNIKKYIKKIKDNVDVKELEESLDKEEIINEYIILGLRLVEGISIKEINNKFNIDFLKKYESSINKLKNLELIDISDNIKLTDKGLDFANIVWEEFV